ncbi:MAG: N-acetyl-gamma-glutamyl-phosphate reductase, partial [Bifidobacteriaceae bacterium]|nr:N-acetyl-gamma-glutamyl-phosphate reductase [Bifidobacteriaceae bacterium]
MSFRVAVAGASGYAGGEVIRLLAAHPEVQVGALSAHANIGDPLGAHHPHIRSLADRILVPPEPARLADHDAVVLALPHGKSGAIADAIIAANPTSILIDLGADHRLQDPTDWDAYYGGPHPGTWTY